MYNLLALLNGLLIAFMILINGTLTEDAGLYFSLAIINLLCFILISLLIYIKKINLAPILKIQKWFYLVGLIGLFNIFLNNINFIHLGATLSMGLTLYGQLIAALIIDFGGFFGIKKQSFHYKKIIGIIIMSLGILIMIIY